jgi:hypothetical protein
MNEAEVKLKQFSQDNLTVQEVSSSSSSSSSASSSIRPSGLFHFQEK